MRGTEIYQKNLRSKNGKITRQIDFQANKKKKKQRPKKCLYLFFFMTALLGIKKDKRRAL